MEKRIDTDGYQVFLCTCPANIPYNFSVHSWFVTNEKGDVNRWEVLFVENESENSWDHIHKNFFSPFDGIRIIPLYQKLRWPVTTRTTIQGDEAKRLISTIESTPQTYPHSDTYELFGPNSNSYTQWIINQHSQLDLSLPWNAIGKRFMRS